MFFIMPILVQLDEKDSLPDCFDCMSYEGFKALRIHPEVKFIMSVSI